MSRNRLEDKNPVALNGCTPLHLATKHGHLEIVRLIVETGVDKSPRFKGKTSLNLVRPRSSYRFYPLLIDNISQFWRQVGSDLAKIFGPFLFSYLMLTGVWMMVLGLTCIMFEAEGVKKCPVFTAMSVIAVPVTNELLIVVISWVYLFGCFHKFIKRYKFWFETYLAELYK